MTTSQQSDSKLIAQACYQSQWQDDAASQHLGLQVLDIDAGYCRLTMQVQNHMLNGHKTCHGGFIFAMADSCFAYACNSDNRPTVASGCSIDYLRPGFAGDTLTAVGKRINRGTRTGLYDVEISNQDGQSVAQFRGRAHQVGEQLLDLSNLKE